MQFASTSVFASSAPVQFTIADTTLTVKGFASPGAFVQIIDGDALIGTTIADSSGLFEKDFMAMRAGLHTLRIGYDDTDGHSSDPLTQTINIRAQSDTAVEYFLPPTLVTNPVSVVEGDLVAFSGSSIPNAIIEIILDGGNQILRPQTDSSGRYTISVDTTGYYFGEHNTAATASQGGLTSFQTLQNPFIIIPVESGAGDDDALARTLDPPIIETGLGDEIETDSETALIRGTGPPNTQIIIYVDGEPIGSTFSNGDGAWFFNVPIGKVSHDVRAVACFDDGCSDFSNLVKIRLTSDLSACSVMRFWLNDYRYWGVNPNNGIDIDITGISGTPPYEVILDWGDGTSERFNRNTAQSFSLHHVYESVGQYNASLTIADEQGCQYTRYFSVDVQEADFNWLWALYVGGPTLALLALLLRRRNHIHTKKLILAR